MVSIVGSRDTSRTHLAVGPTQSSHTQAAPTRTPVLPPASPARPAPHYVPRASHLLLQVVRMKTVRNNLMKDSITFTFFYQKRDIIGNENGINNSENKNI